MPASSRPLVIAAAAFAASTVFGSVVAARENIEGAPFGIKLPISVRTGLLAGWGSGLSAPWPMPAVALTAALRGGPTAGRICAVIGGAVFVGTFVEPVTWSYTSLLNQIVMIGTLGSGAALIREGWRESKSPTRVIVLDLEAGGRAHRHPDDEQRDRSGARPSRALKSS